MLPRSVAVRPCHLGWRTLLKCNKTNHVHVHAVCVCVHAGIYAYDEYMYAYILFNFAYLEHGHVEAYGQVYVCVKFLEYWFTNKRAYVCGHACMSVLLIL